MLTGIRVWSLLAALLLAPLAVAQVDPAVEPWRLEDPAGDLTDQLVRVVPIPDSPLAKHADVTAITLEEVPGQILVGIEVQELTAGQVVPVCCLSYTYYYLDFTVSGVAAQYRLALYAGNEQVANTNTLYAIVTLRAELCIQAPDGFFCDFYQPATATVDDEADKLTIAIDHDALLGKLDPPFSFGSDRPTSLPKALPKGTELRDIVATTFFCWQPYCYVQPSDRVPDAGSAPAYAMRERMGNQGLEMSFPSGATVTVEPGANQSIPFTITNGAAAKRVLGLAYNVTGTDANLAKVRLDGPTQVTVPGGETRTFQLAANAAADLPRDPGLRLNLVATNVADPTESGSASARLAAAPGLGPDRNVLYLRQRFANLDDDLCNGTATGTACSTSGILAFANDEGSGSDGALGPCCSGSGAGGTYHRYVIGSLDALPAPIMFSRDVPVQATFELSLPQEGNVRVEATLSYRTNETTEMVFTETTTALIGTQPTTVEISGPARFNPDADPFLPAGTRFDLALRLNYEGQAMANYALDPKLYTEGTYIRLPLIEVPDHLRYDAPAGPLQMSSVGSPEDFVNPGEARLFRVSVLNQDEVPARFALQAQAPPNWTVDLLPGALFELTPGDTVTLGVLVHAPSDATENDLAQVNLTAWLDGAEAPGATLPLRVVVTLFDLPDDGGMFNASADDAAKLVVEGGGNTPAPALVGSLSVLAAATVVLRRRKP